jgi:hydantoinase/carbamoylase family amidase
LPDAERIAARLEALWEVAHGPGGGADRPAYSAAEAQAMLLVAGWASEQGLEPGVDAHGNLWALPPDWAGPLVTAGSHVDTVPDGGRYDGALGTVLGLELADDLHAAAGEGGRAGILICAAEEAPRFGAGTIGSRLLAGTLNADSLAQMHDAAGTTAAEAQAAYVAALDDLPRITAPTDRLRAHAEVHVAQRRELRELGVVTRVASPRRFELRIDGQAGHSGEVSMESRRDALAAAAEVMLAIEAAARAEPPETVATVGRIAVSPGAVSVIPGQARLAIDVRGIASPSLARLDATIHERVTEICGRREVDCELAMTRAGEPVALDQALAAAALDAARGLGISARETWSGAGHDAQHLNSLTPCLLVFVPLHGGESHTPHEGAAMGEILQAARVVGEVLRQQSLDRESRL